MSLSSLGLTDFEECVYRDLLSGHETTSDGVPAALQRLAALGLVRFDAAGHPVAVEPEIGVSRLIRRRLLETHAQQRRISAAWEAVHLLSARQRGRGRTVTIEQIDGADRVAERIRSLALDAQEVLAMHRSVDLPRPGETTRRRTIVSRKSVLDQAFLDHCRALHRSGDHHRLVDDDGQQLVIVDRAVVFVPSEPGGDSALLISQAGWWRRWRTCSNASGHTPRTSNPAPPPGSPPGNGACCTCWPAPARTRWRPGRWG
ncbi:hypothetical protein ACFQES_15200 [Nonomuraea salmonea]|uniref:hypothetical protein n=1 Tax=Nonomuraea salmonea TaxID=46181 RepID=UPI003606B1F9